MHKQVNLVVFLMLLMSSLAKARGGSGPELKEKSHSTSIAGMSQLLKMEAELITNLDSYAALLQEKLDVIRSALEKLRNENAKSQNNTEAFLSHPLNGFSLIRRMHSDWTNWQLYLEQPIGLDQIKLVQNLRLVMPTSTDLSEAAAALHRIQVTYDLRAKDIAGGLLNGKSYNVTLSPLDRFAIAMHLFDQAKYEEATFWFHALMEDYSTEQGRFHEVMGLDYIKALQLYAAALLKLNRLTDALKVIDIALTIKPDDAKMLQRRKEIDFMIKTEPAKQIVQTKPKVTKYEQGCRGDFKSNSKLHCRYNTTNSAFLKIAPIKLEEIQLDPYMVLFHEVIYPKEIRELQEIARPSLKRATVYNPDTKKNSVMETRTSKVAWLHDNFNPTVARINTRIADMTGFELKGSEMLQVMNYGLGGHYDLHYDFFNLTSNTELNGDRIATVLFYLNDVEQGGATVFPEIDKAVFPQSGAAIVWYNLNHAGVADWRTMHAACPVIVGSKWVANKWIRERQQLFKRPCLKSA